jgi:hypothetical protein
LFVAKTPDGEAAFGDWNDDAPGVKRHIRPLSTVSSECKTDSPSIVSRSGNRKIRPQLGFRKRVSILIEPRGGFLRFDLFDE